MSRTLVHVFLVCLLIAGTVGARATAGQDTTAAPGQPTRARVWVQNQGAAEAVPVRIQGMAPEAQPLRVQVVAVSTTGNDASVVARMARQRWEYRSIGIPNGSDSSAVLNAAGAEGWEATGATMAGDGGTVVIMKRPQ